MTTYHISETFPLIDAISVHEGTLPTSWTFNFPE
jgi:hypothetical protein